MQDLAKQIYNALQDLDYLDYEETQEQDTQDLINDLELLQKQGNGALLNAIKMLIED